jgi:hypothetical protein
MYVNLFKERPADFFAFTFIFAAKLTGNFKNGGVFMGRNLNKFFYFYLYAN